MIANLGDLDPFVEREVVDAFDRKYLNEEVAEFRGSSRAHHGKCGARDFPPPARVSESAVERVRIEETSKNSFELREDLTRRFEGTMDETTIIYIEPWKGLCGLRSRHSTSRECLPNCRRPKIRFGLHRSATVNCERVFPRSPEG